MHSHNVFFWLKDDLSDLVRQEFERGLDSLTKISYVKSGYFGKPSDTHRSIVDNSYSYGLTLQFTDIKNHNIYQNDPIHQVFVDLNSWKWTRVLVYDIETL